ncbi:MAG: hypothetical protein II412_07975, partial [Clostridia bacterium]|nr:hypothetical protein [Clostridia bacterium]
MTGTYRIADRIIRISTRFTRVHRRCAAYRTDDIPADISVEITQSDIERERACSVEAHGQEDFNSGEYLDSALEELAVYRKIAERMTSFDTILMHGSCIAVDGEGYLFTAKSGTGKSTHTRLWREMLGEKAIMVNDDKPLIRISEDRATIYGTPWDGKHHLSTNCAVPLKAICILERAEENEIHRISPVEAYPFLVQQIYRPRDPAAMLQTLQLIDRLSKTVGLWRLGCNMDPEAAQISYHAM